MSATLFTDIRAALTQQLVNMVGLPDVAWENDSYNPSPDSTYIRPTVLWGEGSQAEQGVNGRNWELGIYQITCVCPKGQTTGPVNVLAGKIREQFKRGTTLTYNGVTVTVRKVYLSPERSTDEAVELTVSIPFRCLAAN